MNKSSIALVAVIALAGGFLLSWYFASQKPVQLEAGLWFGEQARALPDFRLSDHNGEALTRERLAGKWNLIFFGFTHCPDICPTSLQVLSDMVRAIDDPDVVDALRVYFISVDPERDKPDTLGSYVTYFNPDFIGATAPLDNLKVLTGSIGIAHSIVDRNDGSADYDVEHSGAIVLINPRAEFAGLFSSPHDAMAMARDLTRIVELN